MDITLRQAQKEDYDFLWKLHELTMKKYVDETWGWEEQFQKQYFDKHSDPSNIQIIKLDSLSVGAVETDHKENKIFLRDLKIHPTYQDRGIGSQILDQIITCSESEQKPITLRVLKVNPARYLYSRFDFAVVHETDTHFIMEREITR